MVYESYNPILHINSHLKRVWCFSFFAVSSVSSLFPKYPRFTEHISDKNNWENTKTYFLFAPSPYDVYVKISTANDIHVRRHYTHMLVLIYTKISHLRDYHSSLDLIHKGTKTNNNNLICRKKENNIFSFTVRKKKQQQKGKVTLYVANG